MMVQVLYTDISSCVVNNGFASPFFKLKRGVRQGCPLSGLLFVLAIELIQGISVGKQEIKLSQYALLRLLDKFKNSSGLEINAHKSQALWLGSWKDRRDKPFCFKWPKDSVYAPGIQFLNGADLVYKLNFLRKTGEPRKSPLKQLEKEKVNSMWKN